MSIKGTNVKYTSTNWYDSLSKRFYIGRQELLISYRTVARHKRIKQMIILTSLAMILSIQKKSLTEIEKFSKSKFSYDFTKGQKIDTW